MSRAEMLAEALHGRRSGDGWVACCPAHDDRHPSLSIRGSGDQVLIKCHAGCEQANVIAALKADGHWDSEVPHNGLDERIAATYDYTDEKGRLQYQVVRLEPKDFRQRRPNGRGGWLWNTKGVRRVLYRLREVVAATVIFFVEGEKDADRLSHAGLVATTAGSSEGWRAEYTDYFHDKEAIVLFDNDEPGRRHARKVCEAIHAIARSVKVVELPGLPVAGDVSDWLEMGHTVRELEELVEACPEFDPRSNLPLLENPSAGKGRILSILDLPPISAFESKLEWLVEDLVPRGSLILWSAPSGCGKSFLVLGLAGAVANGALFIGRKTKQCAVLYLDRENPVYVVQQRLDLLGVPPNPNLHFWGTWNIEQPPDTNDKRLEKFVRDSRPLIIIDSLVAFHPGSENDATETRRFMSTMRVLASSGATIVVLHHTGKSPGSRNFRGSSDIEASVDMAWKLVRIGPKEEALDRLSLMAFKSRVAPGQSVDLRLNPGVGFEEVALTKSEKREVERQAVSGAIAEFLAEFPRSTKNAIEAELTATGRFTRRLVRKALDDGTWTVEQGPKNAQLYSNPDGEEEGDPEMEEIIVS